MAGKGLHPPAAPSPATAPLLRPRWEVFEHGLLPIPKLIFPVHKLSPRLGKLKNNLAAVAVDWRVDAVKLAEALDITEDQAALVLCTLAAVLPAEDSALGDGATADFRDVLLLLYIQPYCKRELVSSKNRCFMPQADEEAHQMSYLQKNMKNIITLLADSVVEGSLVLTMDTFRHLGFLVFSEGTSLIKATDLFANSPAPILADPVFDGMSVKITPSPESNHQTVSNLDMTEANKSHPCNNTPSDNPAYYRNVTFVEGFSQTSVVKHASDVKGNSLKVLNCHDSVVYILAPLKYATVSGCSDAKVVLGAVGKAIKVKNCERVRITATAKSICIADCRECIFYLGVNHRPIVAGDNHKLRVAPFNTCYTQLRDHMEQVGIDPSVNKWDQPVFVSVAVDPRDSDVNAESSVTCLDPDLFTNHLIPSCWNKMQGHTNCNPFPLPEIYEPFLNKKCKEGSALQDTQETILTERKEKRPYSECKLLGGAYFGCGQCNESSIYYESLADYIKKSTNNVHTDAGSGLSNNQIVKEFREPWGTGDVTLVKYTPQGYSIVGGLISHVTNTHLNERSWNGKITADMFFVCQDQIHIFPWAIGEKTYSTDACWYDLCALLKLIWEASVLRLPNNEKAVYPLHLERLGHYFGKISQLSSNRGSVLGLKFATYIRCNPAFISHSQKSCICWHLRRFELSRNASEKKLFINIIESIDPHYVWSEKTNDHILLSKFFQKAKENGAPYGKGSYELYKFVRDWHTHCQEGANATDEIKRKYRFEMLETIAEVIFGSYLSDILFHLLVKGIDIDAWLSDLNPAHPMQNRMMKGG